MAPIHLLRRIHSSIYSIQIDFCWSTFYKRKKARKRKEKKTKAKTRVSSSNAMRPPPFKMCVCVCRTKTTTKAQAKPSKAKKAKKLTEKSGEGNRNPVNKILRNIWYFRYHHRLFPTADTPFPRSAEPSLPTLTRWASRC